MPQLANALTRRTQDHRHFIASLDRDRAAAFEQADKALDVIGGEGAADRALGERGIGEDELHPVAAVELRDDVAERGFGKDKFALLPREGFANRFGSDFFDDGLGCE